MIELGGGPIAVTPLAAPEFLTDPEVVVEDPGVLNTGGPVVRFDWDFVQAEGLPQAFYRLRLVDTATDKVVYSTGIRDGSRAYWELDWDAEELDTQTSDLAVRVDAFVEHLGVLYPAHQVLPIEVDFGDPQCTILEPGEIVQVTDGVDVKWLFEDEGGRTQSAFRVRLIVVASGVVLHDSGWVQSEESTYHVPALLSHGVRYAVEVQLKNNHGMRSE